MRITPNTKYITEVVYRLTVGIGFRPFPYIFQFLAFLYPVNLCHYNKT